MNPFEKIWIILLILWGLPFTYYRSRFRKTVYRTNSWKINIKPVFRKEIKALFGNIYPYDNIYIRIRNIYRFYLIIYFLLFTGFKISATTSTEKLNNMKKIEIGDQIPEFELPDQNGNLYKIKDVLGKKNLVIFFYPKDDTPGCTAQACSFRDQYEDFADANAEVIGISGQSVESHLQFAKKHQLTYTLLSDKNNRIRKQFGVPGNFFGLIPGRVTYIVNTRGTVVHTFNSQTKVHDHVKEALKILANP